MKDIGGREGEERERGRERGGQREVGRAGDEGQTKRESGKRNRLYR